MKTGRPQVVDAVLAPQAQRRGQQHQGHLPGGARLKDQQPAAFSPKTGLFYVPTNHVCMDYEPFKVSYTAGQPYVGATLSMYPPQGARQPRQLHRLGRRHRQDRLVEPEPFSVWSGALATAGDVVFYGTLEGYLKAVDTKTGKELYSSRPRPASSATSTPTRTRASSTSPCSPGVGGWAGIGMAAGPDRSDTDGLGAVGAYKALSNYTQLGGVLTVFGLD